MRFPANYGTVVPQIDIAGRLIPLISGWDSFVLRFRNFYGERMKQQPARPNYVPNTGREIMGIRNGVQLERAFVWLPHDSWEQLRELGKRNGVSDSIVLQHLISITHRTYPQERQ